MLLSPSLPLRGKGASSQLSPNGYGARHHQKTNRENCTHGEGIELN
jgi:hypothetical protein